MKKLLVLVVVLVVASLANATVMDKISLSYAGGIITITGLVNTPDRVLTGGIYVQGAQAATIGAPLNSYAAAGDLRNITQWEGYNGVDINVQKSSLGSLATGKWFEFGITTALSSVILDIYDYDVSYAVPEGQVTVLIPEPATIALLTLGGLLLRRKK